MIVHEQMEHYVRSLVPPRSELLQRLETEAENEGIPNMVLSGISLLSVLAAIKQPKRILEIGTAIGYSALVMAEAAPMAQIITLELNEERADRARVNIEAAGMEERIQVVLGDASETIAHQEGTFDFVFIDAAKGKYPLFLEAALAKCSPGAVIVTDNILFRGYVGMDAEDPQIPKKYRSMIKKVKAYNEMLMNHPLLQTSILTVGDGIAVSVMNRESR
ncbi:O-methyltransferase [Marinicrinis lubricantis]|uniref:tRNA 5-hydroxyuridine methyltransferase n=1 Tax=Marinicrinis lubricantis TaxID=2086470 RepID=A0ABW1IW97_9BACL